MNIVIVTGASRGLGEAIARLYLEKLFILFTVSRNENKVFKQEAEKSKLPYKHFHCDLSEPEQQAKVLNYIISEIHSFPTVDEIHLINNAGLVEPIEAIGHLKQIDLQRILNVNVLAPMFITNRFVQEFPSNQLKVINVTSGSANHSTHGWSAYSSTKAALNRFTQTAALESNATDSPHTFIGYSPGVMNTEMQAVIRSSDFLEVETFKAYKEKGQLRSPKVVAQALIDALFGVQPLENGRIYHVSELIK